MKKATVLIVDDDKNILLSLSRGLNTEGYRVFTASTGKEAIQLVEDNNIDLLLLDIWLPETDGTKVLEKVKEIDPDIIAIIMSGQPSLETATKAVKATQLGAYDFLEKPFSLDKILQTIENALENRKLKKENIELKQKVEVEYKLIGSSSVIRELKEKIKLIAPTSSTVLICGENGSGKEIVARELHRNSSRADANFLVVNCAAIPHELIESELFGHEKGAFTGAYERRRGKFELADGGTIFLDEIGDMSLSAQAKILRVLEEGVIERVGGSKKIPVDVRVIAATNKNLEEEIKKGTFRQDLYFRLNVVPIFVPPLRDHKEDIPELAEYFLYQYCRREGVSSKKFTKDALDLLLNYDYPGNVRELRNIVERAAILIQKHTISAYDLIPILPAGFKISEEKEKLKIDVPKSSPKVSLPLKKALELYEKELILQTLEETNWNITQAAHKLKLERSHLYKKMRALGIKY